MITKEQYLADPRKAVSIPYWKAKTITIPDGMRLLHQDEYDSTKYQNYIDEPYFRLFHDLKGLSKPVLTQGYTLCSVRWPSMPNTLAVAMTVSASRKKN